jgi:hypothetical protein
MANPKRHQWMLWMAVWALALRPEGVRGAEAPSQEVTPAHILAKLSPLPESVPRTIMNPYHAEPAWKLWAQDPAPVTIDKPDFQGTFQAPDVGLRKYPVYALKRGTPELVLEPLGQKAYAGFWDDCYVSLDDHHTRLTRPSKQFIDGGKMRTAGDVQTLLEIGANFTSQSYADRGRAIVDDILNNLNTERHFFFANCIRATPSHASYEDKQEDKVTDLYDGLFAHSYHSLGQSGSEVHALYKMMVAGACMPRSTKDLLKRHGAYAMALLTIFKAALPYADAQGRELPYEHELRHRPVYSSHGTPAHAHYCPANAHYHGYDEQRHLRTMMDLARGLDAAPPVAVANLLSFHVIKNGEVISEPARLRDQVKCISLTNMRFWGGQDEVLAVRIDLNKSYDLQHRELRFTCQALYPNQKNVIISPEAPGIFRILVKHDPRLPKGRIPVICTASNGLPLPSNPVFINFYWPGENEIDDYFALRGLSDDVRRQIDALGLKRLLVTVNKRPIVDFGFSGDALRCLPGQTVSLDLKAEDPEGFPVSVFRRSGQIGAVEQGRYTVTIPESDRNEVYRVHFIFSDGTGGYTGKQIKLLVGGQEDGLPEDWAVTALGQVSRAVHVSLQGSTFTFDKQPLDREGKQTQGTFVFRPVHRTADLMCRIPPVNAGSDLALLMANTLDDFSRRAGIGFFQGKIAGVVKSREQSGVERPYQWEGDHAAQPAYFRLTLANAVVAAYLSADGQTWEQVMVRRLDFFERCYGGLIYRGDPWTTGSCHWLPSSGVALPVFTTDPKTPGPEGAYGSPLKVTVTSPAAEMRLHYTLDGSAPNAASPVYEGPIELSTLGRHEVRVTVFHDERAQGTALAVYPLK